MANIKSQKKRILTNEKARLRNKSVKSALKTAVRKFHEAAASGNGDAKALAADANKALDKALELVNGHSLSLLLRRVMLAGWPPASFASMRNQLHHKVEAGLKDLEEVLVNASR